MEKKLADEYEQLVYSEYLDVENTEKIVGIDYQSETPDEEKPEEKEEPEETKTEEKTQWSQVRKKTKQWTKVLWEVRPEKPNLREVRQKKVNPMNLRKVRQWKAGRVKRKLRRKALPRR